MWMCMTCSACSHTSNYCPVLHCFAPSKSNYTHKLLASQSLNCTINDDFWTLVHFQYSSNTFFFLSLFSYHISCLSNLSLFFLLFLSLSICIITYWVFKKGFFLYYTYVWFFFFYLWGKTIKLLFLLTHILCVISSTLLVFLLVVVYIYKRICCCCCCCVEKQEKWGLSKK